jgi:DNA-binding response OmpR family regulator
MKLLVVEDEARIAAFLMKGLTAQGYAIEWASTGAEGLNLGMAPDVALVILDLKLPDLDGLDVLAGLRERGATIPVVILSARAEVADRVRGLDLGADDYLPKPFAFTELLARVRARLRYGAAGNGVLHAGGIYLDVLTREVTVAGRTVGLSDREFALLRAFVSHPRRILSRRDLLAMAWDMHFDPQTNLVDVYVGYLRRKLGETVIETVRGAGYRLPIDGSPAYPVAPWRGDMPWCRADLPSCPGLLMRCPIRAIRSGCAPTLRCSTGGWRRPTRPIAVPSPPCARPGTSNGTI